MIDCLNCGKEVPQTEGKRQRKYCDDNCKMAYHNKTSNKKEPKYVLLKTFKALQEKYNALESLQRENKPNTAPETKKQTPNTLNEEKLVETPKNNDKITELQDELKNLPEKGTFATQRRKFLEKQITGLKKLNPVYNK